MKIYTNKIIAALILISVGVILFAGVFSYGKHSHNKHGFASTTNCPFMQHEESLCPMTAFDHLSALRNLYETATFKTFVFNFYLGLALVAGFNALKAKWWLSFCLNTFWRWRQKAKYKYCVRRHQELFADGLLNPKLFLF